MMDRQLAFFYTLVAGLGLFANSLQGQQEAAPDYQEVYDLVRQHLPGATEADLNRAAIQGLIAQYSPKLRLVTGKDEGEALASALVTRTNVFDDTIGYVRVGSVWQGLADAVRTSWLSLNAGKKLNGLVLDLRYTGGEDYEAAARVADLFVRKEAPLLKWGTGSARSSANNDVLNVPVAVLINRETSAAAEALAAVLRETGTGLLLGSPTSGDALVYREFKLKNGERLKVATGQVQLGDGSELPEDGVQPDIAVEVSPEDETAYFANAFLVINPEAATNVASAETNAPRRVRMNEAELVREKREGTRLPPDIAPRRFEPEKPVVHDPALARALDLLKGLAVVRKSRS